MAPQLAEPLLAASPSSASTRSDVGPVLLMVCSELLLASVNAIVKSVSSWPAERIMLVRFGVDLVLCLCVCAWRRLELPALADIVTLCLRGLAYCLGVLFFWSAIRSCLPIGDVVVLLLSASPLFLVLLARMVLAERIPKEWPLQMAFLVLGAVLVNKPGSLDESCPLSTALLPMGAAVCWSLMNLASRRVPHVPSVQVMLFNDMAAIVFACATSLILRAWGGGMTAALDALTPPLDRSTLLVMGSAVLGWLGLMGNVKGYQTVSVAAVATIAGSTSIPFNYCFQVLLFHEPLDLYSAAGATIVTATTIVMTVLRHLAA